MEVSIKSNLGVFNISLWSYENYKDSADKKVSIFYNFKKISIKNKKYWMKACILF